jgi:AraC-like DNA-binding protein
MGQPAGSRDRSLPIDVDATPDDAFALTERYPPFAGEWHAHAKHQLCFAASGTAVLTVEDTRWLLPPHRAAWIPAKTRHRLGSATGIALHAVYLAPPLVPLPRSRELSDCRVFTVTPLAREMLVFATRWGPTRGALPSSPDTRTRQAFFVALAGLAAEWMRGDRLPGLPVARTPELERASAYVAKHLAEATVGSTAKAAGMSVRTLSRRFDAEVHMSFRTYLQIARVQRALELLALPRASVAQVGYEVGFSSPSAFATAFSSRCGETPSAYVARVRSGTTRSIGGASR